MKRILTMMLAIAMISGGVLYPFFERANYSAKDTAMAHSVAVSDDIYALYNNPAGIGLATKIEAMFNFEFPYAGLFDGLDLMNMNGGVLVPLPLFVRLPGTVAATFSYFSSPYHSEVTTMLAYGITLKDLLGAGTRLCVGANLKLYNYTLDTGNEYIAANPLFQTYGTSKWIFNLDVGGIYFISDVIQIGVAMTSLLPVDVNLFQTGDENYASEPLESVIKVGGTWHLPEFWIIENPMLAFSYNMVSMPDAIRKSPAEYHIGFRFTQFNEILTFRMGYETDLGERDLSNLGVGLGVRVDIHGHEIVFDYAFAIPIHISSSGMDGGFGNHQVTVLYKWRLHDYLLADNTRDRFELREKFLKKEIMKDIRRRIDVPVPEELRPDDEAPATNETSSVTNVNDEDGATDVDATSEPSEENDEGVDNGEDDNDEDAADAGDETDDDATLPKNDTTEETGDDE